MQILNNRKARKALKETLHHARHIRHMHEDVANPDLVDRLHRAEKEGRALYRGRDGEQQIQHMIGTLEQLCGKVAPPRPRPKVRENVEVLFVAIAAAMAIRAYFFQPFKIPTGSMQPTLYGITMQEESTLPMSNPLFKAANLILFGENDQAVRAKASGSLRMKQRIDGMRELDLQTTAGQTHYIVYIGDTPHKIAASLFISNADRIRSLFGKHIRKGDLLAGGLKKSGDYILVNRIKYNFFPPKRGDIVVFDTRDMTHPDVRNNTYYIKRLVGLPGETISLAPPYLKVNGERPTDSRFQKIFSNEAYHGYQFANSSNPIHRIGGPDDQISLADDEYLFFGDNTTMSLDGRYFGAVKRERILGPAFFVCWPLDRAGPAERWN